MSNVCQFCFAQEEGVLFKCKDDFSPSNVMDRWILSFTQSLVTYVRDEMASKSGGRKGKHEYYYCCPLTIQSTTCTL